MRRIGDVREADAGRAGGVVRRAAHRGVPALFDAALNHGRQKGRRANDAVRFTEHVVVLAGHVDKECELLFEGVEEFVECC